MRHNLEALEEQRCKFTGRFERIGYKPGYRGSASTMTALIKNIRDTRNILMTDHSWLNYTKGLQEMNLSRGDVIEFQARVKKYWKGAKKKLDYRLSHPTQIKKVVKNYSTASVTLGERQWSAEYAASFVNWND